MEKSISPLKIAVIGAGVAGVAAAWALRKKHQVILFEKNSYVGGHTNTVIVDDPSGDKLSIDTGFIVCNAPNYPNFYQLLDQLNVSLRNAEMSFGYRCEDASVAYVGPGIAEFLRLPNSLFNFDLIKIIFEQSRFNKKALSDLASSGTIDGTLYDYTQRLGCSNLFIKHYLTPIAAAIWSSSDKGILEFPIHTFLTFMRNHGMLELSKRPQWQTVIGGSRTYIEAFQKLFNGEIRRDSAVQSITRASNSVKIMSRHGEESFDKVILACHADEALSLLSDPSELEAILLGSWSYSKNITVLHSDDSVLPHNRRNWASWNYYRRGDSDPSAPLSITYYMNRLQGLDSQKDYFVTLNNDQIAKDQIHYQTSYSHPQYSAESVASQSKLRGLNGSNHTFYCGSYMGYGFHEDAVTSALSAAKLLGGEI